MEDNICQQETLMVGDDTHQTLVQDAPEKAPLSAGYSPADPNAQQNDTCSGITNGFIN